MKSAFFLSDRHLHGTTCEAESNPGQTMQLAHIELQVLSLQTYGKTKPVLHKRPNQWHSLTEAQMH